MNEITGWLLDIYEAGERGLALWVITDEDKRVCLYQSFPVRFFASGPTLRLRELCRWLRTRPIPPALARMERRDLFLPQPIPVLSIEVQKPAALKSIFAETEKCFPDLVYYDADIQVQVRHAAEYGSFPLVRCRISFDSQGNVLSFQALDSRWEIDPEPPPLRVLEIDLDNDPSHAQPTYMELQYRSWKHKFSLLEDDSPSFWLKTVLRKFDPDIILTNFGDTWLLEYLLKRVGNNIRELPLNRDLTRGIRTIREKTYFSYGQIIFRGRQVHLFGRIHIDRKNTLLWSDLKLIGILENARLTAIPIQSAARLSPGTGISCMQMITALQSEILIPWHKQQVEKSRSLMDMIHSDFGGLVYQPTIGLHHNVAAIDFVSLYPSVMVRCNISPEKSALSFSDPPPEDLGLIPKTLAPLIEKRILIKKSIPQIPSLDPRHKWYEARASAEKWLLVVCFGYLGYKSARFGLIGSHEAVTNRGREALLHAKKIAEDDDYSILHMFVDGLWLQRSDCKNPEDFQPVLDEITRSTGLPIALDGVFRWIAFLSSRRDIRVPVGNRYFGTYLDGTIKARGIDARRHDTSYWVASTQIALIKHFAKAPDAELLPEYIPDAIEIVRQALHLLRTGKVNVEDLLVRQKLSRPPEKYKNPSPGAYAALQLKAVGKEIIRGQRVRFLYVTGKPNVWAWDQPDPFDVRRIDVKKYRKLMLRAASDIFQPFGIDSQVLELLLEGNATAVPLFKLKENTYYPQLQAQLINK